MPSLSPYLFFDGTCREAMTAYADILDAEIQMTMTYGEAPPDAEMPDVSPDLIMHMGLKFGDHLLMASDDMPGRYTAPAATHVMVSLESVDAARRAFDRLAEGGETKLAFAATFWSAGFGVVRDRWGQLWMIGVDDAPA